ncbi:InlB B-repeat-containing protein [Burkholderia cenocepacia]|uniref:InlB B-repeat-containing protein n=1 Tax=Burkholderia cenocepacia TaxID=95486 RepID=UPI000F598386|nr:zinc-dependent metalloprotease family protein [Burkholderia cenocepacia]RQU52938.1 hypothetical protein DF143_32720 [Burkholderia cenocepacia]RQV35060.1 hypothetical protein DF033_32050 [Burkholderia cenocepacia]
MNKENQALLLALPKVPHTDDVFPRRAGINVANLRNVFPTGNNAPVANGLQMNVSDDVQVYLTTVRVREGGQPGSWVWYGRLAGSQAVYGHLAVTGLDGADHAVVVSASVHINAQAYTIESNGEAGEVSVAQMGKLLPAHCGTDRHALVGLSGGSGAAAFGASRSALGEQAATPTAIHVLVVYGPTLAQRYPGGRDGLLARVAHWTEVGNTIFANSGVSAMFTFDLAEASLMQARSVVKVLHDEIGKVDSTQIPCQPSGPVAQQVSTLRDQYKADLVVGLAEVSEMKPEGEVLGIANFVARAPRSDWATLPYACCAVALTAATRQPAPDYVMTHELGHLLGLMHDVVTTDDRQDDGDAQYDYGRGYVPPDKSFVTTMGYERTGIGPHIPYFSTPDRKWNGQPVGAPIGSANESDAALFLRGTTQAVSHYRSQRDTAEQFTLFGSVVPELGGYLIVDPPGRYEPGARVRVRAVPRDGFAFQRLLVNGAPVESEDTVLTVTDNVQVVAEFDAGVSFYQVSTKIEASDAHPEAATLTVDPWQPHYQPGTDVKVRMQAADDIAFLGWELDGHSMWNSVNTGSTAELYMRVEQNHEVIAHVGKRDCLVDVSGLPATLGTIGLISEAGLPESSMAFFRYGAATGQVMTFRAEAYDDTPFERWQVSAGRILREYQKETHHYVDVLIERSGSVIACFSHDEPLVEVTTSIAPARPYGPALLNVAPTNVPDAAPGYWYPKNTSITLSVYWWNDDDKDKYGLTWRVEQGGTVRTYPDETVTLTVDSQTHVQVTLTPK